MAAAVGAVRGFQIAARRVLPRAVGRRRDVVHPVHQGAAGHHRRQAWGLGDLRQAHHGAPMGDHPADHHHRAAVHGRRGEGDLQGPPGSLRSDCPPSFLSANRAGISDRDQWANRSWVGSYPLSQQK
jgi:hypothetical protein